MNITTLKEEIVLQLKANINTKKAEGAKKSYSTKMKVLGVKVPDLKKVLKKFKPEIKQLSEVDKIKLIKELNDTNIFECQQFGFEIINYDKDLLSNLTEKDAFEMQKNLDNWLSVDYFAGVLIGPLWRERKISDKKIIQFARSKDFWERRIAVVSTVALNQKARGGKGDAKKTLKICALVVEDDNDMVIKALSWALRKLAKVDKQPVIEFVKKYNDVLSPKVKREVENKLKFGTKNKN